MNEIERICADLRDARERLVLTIVRERPAGLAPPDAADLAALVANGDQEFGRRGFRALIDELIRDGRLTTVLGDGPITASRPRRRPFLRVADAPDADG